MKTLQIAGNSTVGGATYLLLKWCEFLVEKGCEVDVLSTDPATVKLLQDIAGVNVITNIFIPREIRPAADAKAFVKLFRLFREKKYDVVHTYSATPGFLGRIVGRLANVPVVVHHQAGWAVTEFTPLLQRLFYTPLEYISVFSSTRSICVSHAVAKQARKFHVAPQKKLVTICNGIDPARFLKATEQQKGTQIRKELQLSPEHIVFGNIGRLAAQKDFHSFIRALPILKQRITQPFVALVVGTGPDRDSLEALARDLDVTDNVRFLGFRKDIPEILNAMDFFVSPSLWEGLSISIMEAMAAAKPIVTTTILPNAELIEHEQTGLLVEPKSPEQIAEAIARFVHEPELAQRCAAAARQRLLESYTLERMLNETWDLYVDLLERD